MFTLLSPCFSHRARSLRAAAAFLLASPLSLSALTDAEIMSAGLTAWRRPDNNGISCADCHGPMGYDIAVFNFGQADLRRAAAPHVTQPEADAIFVMLERHRALYPVAGGLKNVATFRPLQPADGALVGSDSETPEQQDAAFGLYLEQNFQFAASRLTTLAQARAAAQQLTEVDIAATPIGLRFVPWSRATSREGTVHGGEIAEWLPAIGFKPKSAYASQWRGLNDAYIANPSNANFWALFHKIETWLEPDSHNATAATGSGWVALARDQFRGNLIFQHDLLQRARNLPALLDLEDGTQPFKAQASQGTSNLGFFWTIADRARVGQGDPLSSLATRNQETVYTDSTMRLQYQIGDFRITWFWMGWMLDNGLRFSGASNSTKTGEYLISNLWDGANPVDGNPTGWRFHQVFFNAAHHMKVAFKAGCWPSTESRPQAFMAYKNYFLGYDKYKKNGHQFDTAGYPGSLARYQRALANYARMAVLIHDDEIKRLGVIYTMDNDRAKAIAYAETLRNVLHWADSAWTAADDAAVDAYIATLQSYPLAQ